MLCWARLCVVQVLQQPDERVPGGTTASKQALEKLAVKYCTKRGGGARTSVQVGTRAHTAALQVVLHALTSAVLSFLHASTMVLCGWQGAWHMQVYSHETCVAVHWVMVCHMAVQVEAEMMAHIAAAEKKSNILERQLNQVSIRQQPLLALALAVVSLDRHVCEHLLLSAANLTDG